MGTGVGEAMLIGAMTGAGTSAITGNDPLKGALLGAAGGGIGAGVGGALAGGSSGAATGTVTGAGTGAGAGTAGAAEASLMANANAANTVAQAAQQSALESTGSQIAADNAFRQTYMDQLPSLASSAPSAATPATASRLGTLMQNNPITTAMTGATLANVLGQRPPGIAEKEPYSGPLSKFKYDPERYRPAFASGGIADLPVAAQYRSGGDLGGYSDGGRMLKGPGDGMSDSIPAMIGKRQPARLADGEFVVPADVVSHLGNGSTDAGAKQLYSMMDKVRQQRTGKKSQAKAINPRKVMPA